MDSVNPATARPDSGAVGFQIRRGGDDGVAARTRGTRWGGQSVARAPGVGGIGRVPGPRSKAVAKGVIAARPLRNKKSRAAPATGAAAESCSLTPLVFVPVNCPP